MTNKLTDTASACLVCTRDGGMTKCNDYLCGCTDCEIHHCACDRVSTLMCRFRPFLSTDVWFQWLVVFFSETLMVLCVDHACKLILTFIRNVRVELNMLGTESLLCYHFSSYREYSILISYQRLCSRVKTKSSLERWTAL